MAQSPLSTPVAPAGGLLDLQVLLNCNVYAPQPLGLCDIVIGGGLIVGILPRTTASSSTSESSESSASPASPASSSPSSSPSSSSPSSSPSSSSPSPVLSGLLGVCKDVVDMEGRTAVPGFIDMHVHVTGGGGEKGPASRVPEAQVSQLIDSGVTTVVGVLGTDGISRSLENLLFKVQALNEEGITAYMYTGNYRVPVVTLTGTVQRDMTLIAPVIGVGEVAVSDHRGSQPDTPALAALASDARVGGLLSGKAGVVHVHMGDAASALQPLWDVINNTPIPITQFVPTHMGRNPKLARQGIEWVNSGGYVDFTADEGAIIADYIQDYFNYGKEGAKDRITVSSDSYGSLPTFNDKGDLVGYTYGKPDSLLAILKLLLSRGWSMADSVALLTVNPARVLKLQHCKGTITTGHHADIVIFDSNLNIEYVVAKGKMVKSPGYTKKAMFE